MPNHPQVSVILPVYNGSRVLAAGIDSILRQTFRDFEFVIVDDGSTDGSGDLLAGYARSDARIVLRRHVTNLGITPALNNVARAATGEFIAVMNQDDVSAPDRLERQVAYLRNHGDVGALGSAARVVNEHGAPIRVRRYPTQPGLTAWSLIFFNSLLHPSIMFRRSALAAVGFYPLGYAGGTEDYGLCIRLSRVTRLVNLPDVLLDYRTWEKNVTTTAWKTQESEATRIVREHASELLGHQISTDEAYALRGLSTDRYPTDIHTIESLGAQIQGLRRAFLRTYRVTPADRRAVNRDAGVRLWLLAFLARRSPKVAASLAAAATRVSPFSGLAFAAKASRRLASGLAARSTAGR